MNDTFHAGPLEAHSRVVLDALALGDFTILFEEAPQLVGSDLTLTMFTAAAATAAVPAKVSHVQLHGAGWSCCRDRKPLVNRFVNRSASHDGPHGGVLELARADCQARLDPMLQKNTQKFGMIGQG